MYVCMQLYVHVKTLNVCMYVCMNAKDLEAVSTNVVCMYFMYVCMHVCLCILLIQDISLFKESVSDF